MKIEDWRFTKEGQDIDMKSSTMHYLDAAVYYKFWCYVLCNMTSKT